MRCLVSAGLLVVGLVGSTGVFATEPIVPPDTPRAGPATPEPWGDPEEDDASDRGWTWFGMGYEQRMQATGAATDSGGTGSGGPTGHRNSRRK